MATTRNRAAPAYHLLEQFTPFLGEEEIFHAAEAPPLFAEVAEENLLSLPKDAPKVPSINELRAELKKSKTPEAIALDFTFGKMGGKEFGGALYGALKKVPWMSEAETKFPVQLARLGAEAYVRGISVPEENRLQVGFVARPSQMTDSPNIKLRAHFLHYAIRLLYASASKALKPEERRAQMDKLPALFSRMQAEVSFASRSGSNLSGIDAGLLLGYRRLLVVIFWTHYQDLIDNQLLRAGKSKAEFEEARKSIDADFKRGLFTGVDDDHAHAPSFDLTKKVYRDYFSPSAKTDIGYKYFSKAISPAAPPEYKMPFLTILARRRDHVDFLFRLDKPPLAPLPQRLHDSAAWQTWLRSKWDDELKAQSPEDRLKTCLAVISAYFQAFTAHVPQDLEEGCSVPNYLTRAYPRAVTGSLIHDCAIYALRWIHMLGGLLDQKRLADGIKSFRIFIVEMPSHVGALIRLTFVSGKETAVVINNKSGTMHPLDAGDSDGLAADLVVAGMYQGMKTPFKLRPIKSPPKSASLLWNEFCKMSKTPLNLPYPGPNEPHLLYLEHHAAVARISRSVYKSATQHWLELLERVGADPKKAKAEDIQRYKKAMEEVLKAASAEFDAEVTPIVNAINDDIARNESKVKKTGAETVEIAAGSHPWQSAWNDHVRELDREFKSGDITKADPRQFFADDDFDATIR